MEKLTKKLDDGRLMAYPNNDTGLPEIVLKSDPYYGIIEKLNEYQNLEEQGLLVKLPCKVGDTVYADSGVFGILSYTIDGIVIDNYGFIFQASSYSDPIGDCPSECLDEFEKDISEFGKSVFLIREQAEQALKEMEGRNE